MPETTTTTTTTTTDICLEHKIELGLMAELVKRTYFASGGAGAGTLMLNSMDNLSEERPAKYIVVHALPCATVAPGMPFRKVSVKIVALTHIPTHRDGKLCKILYNECFQFLSGLTKATLSTATGLTIDGIVQAQGEQAFEPIKDYQILVATCDVYLTKN